jgi:hypothetical protein
MGSSQSYIDHYVASYIDFEISGDNEETKYSRIGAKVRPLLLAFSKVIHTYFDFYYLYILIFICLETLKFLKLKQGLNFLNFIVPQRFCFKLYALLQLY